MRSPRGAGCASRASPPNRIVVGGDSAGGGLTLALAMRLRDAGERSAGLPLAGVAVDRPDDVGRDARDQGRGRSAHSQGLSRRTRATPMFPRAWSRTDPRISPLFADLRGLPPMLIQVGSAETLLDDSVRFAGAAGAAGVAVTLEIWPDMIHAWPLWNAKLEAGRQALAQAGAFLRPALVIRLLRFDATAPPGRGGRACRARSSAATRSARCASAP